MEVFIPWGWSLCLLGMVPESPMMSPGSHCDTCDNKPFGCLGKPQKATVSGLLHWGQTSAGEQKGCPSHCVLSEGTERICWTRTLAGPGVLVPTCHVPRLWLQLLRGQESLSQLLSSCLHISEVSYHPASRARTCKDTPESLVCPRMVPGTGGSPSAVLWQSGQFFNAQLQ